MMIVESFPLQIVIVAVARDEYALQLLFNPSLSGNDEHVRMEVSLLLRAGYKTPNEAWQAMAAAFRQQLASAGGGV